MKQFSEATFVPIAPEDMPRDPHGTAPGWRFRLLEHGGAEPDTMPQCIEAIDPQGRSAFYAALEDVVPVGQRPQDPNDDGRGWTFETLDHDELGVPHSIIATDAEGRAAAYLPLMEDGVVGRWGSVSV